MIAHSNDFKEAITRTGRDLKIKIEYFYKTYNLETEDNKLLLTEDNIKLLTEEMATARPLGYITKDDIGGFLTEDDIVSLRKNNLGELLRTYMKSFDLETTHNFKVGDMMIIKIGTTVGNEVEYLNYGLFYVYEKKYNEDTKTYTYTVCDKMLFTMRQFDVDEIIYTDTIRLDDLIVDTLDYCANSGGIIIYNGQRYYRSEVRNIPNGDKRIYKKTFEGLNLTCRDVLDMVMQCTGTSMVVNYMELGDILFEQFIYKTPSATSVDTIGEDILNTSKIQMTKKFGPINSLLLSRADENDNIEKKDTSSISQNGMTRYVIKDNLILEQDNREDFLDNIFNQLNGLEYYTCDIDTIGLMYIEFLDRFDVDANNNLYHCLCLKNAGEIDNGMSESFTTEEPKEEQVTYENIGTDDKKAAITMDKLKGEIVLKTYVDSEDGKTKIAQVRLDSSAEEGSSVEITADNIDFSSHTFNLDTDDIAIESDVVDINKDGIFIDGSGSSATFIISDDTKNTRCEIFGSQFAMRDKYNAYGLSMYRYHRTSQGQDIYGYQMDIEDSAGNYSTLTADSLYTTSVHATNVYYDNLIPNSLEERKKDFEPLKNGLDIIKDIDIYKFRYKNEEDTKKHIGLVIGDDYNYSQEITSNDNNGVDLYSFISVCCKAIQEQQEQIEDLKKEIENLKGGNK